MKVKLKDLVPGTIWGGRVTSVGPCPLDDHPLVSFAARPELDLPQGSHYCMHWLTWGTPEADEYEVDVESVPAFPVDAVL